MLASGNDYRLEGQFICERRFHVSDVFQKLPAPVRAVAAAFFKRPIISRYTGTFLGIVRLPDGSLHRIELSSQSEYDLVH